MAFLLAAPAIIAFFVGLRWGRRVSAAALALCILCAVCTIHLAHASYQAEPDGNAHIIRGSVGFASTFGALAALGPLVSTRWPIALAVSSAAIALFIVSGLPLLFACALFGACTAYP